MNNAFIGISLALTLCIFNNIPSDLSWYENKYGADDPVNVSLSAIYARAQYLEDKKIPYRKDSTAAENEVNGYDCGGFTQNSLKYGGIKLLRLTSNKSWFCWPGKNIEGDKNLMWNRVQFPNIIYFSYPVKAGRAPRPFGHTGLAKTDKRLEKKKQVFDFWEASSSAKVIKTTTIISGDYRDTYWVGLKVMNIREILETLQKEKKS